MPEWYPELLATVSQHVVTGHRRAVRAANTELLASYWRIGKEILDRQQAEGWGTKVIDRLSADLKRQLPDARGFSPRNLKYMRAFAAAWPDREIVQRSAAQLRWRHHQVLLDKLDEAELREWYAAAASDAGWSRDVLVLQIEGRLHAEYALRDYAAPIGVAERQTQITKNLPEELASSLPSVEQLEAERAADVWEDES